MPSSFPEGLAEALEKINAHNIDKVTGGYVGPVCTAEFEADALIKGRFHDRKSSLIFLTDSDIPTDLGDRCLVVNVFTGRRLRVATTSRSTRETAFKGLGVESQQRKSGMSQSILSTRELDA